MLIIMHGLPGSGKSTIAQTLVDENGDLVRVNRDDIRTELFGEQYHNDAPIPSAEKRVTDVVHERIKNAFANDKSVISDDTNLNRRNFKEMVSIALKWNQTVHHHYVEVPVSVCKARNSQRDRVVPNHVIDKMASRAVENVETGKLIRF